MRNFVKEGYNLDYPNPDGAAALSAGDPLRYGDNLVAVALVDIAAGVTGSVVTEGVVTLTKLGADAMEIGDRVFLDHANKRVQLATGSDGGSPDLAFVCAGVVVEAAAGSGTTTVKVKLNVSQPTA